MHSAVSPASLPNRAPISGAFAPLLARHTISPSRGTIIAAPVAPVTSHACSTISFKTISNARSVATSGETLPLLCAANSAANSPRSVSDPACTFLTEVSSGSGVGLSGIVHQAQGSFVLCGVSPQSRSLSIYFQDVPGPPPVFSANSAALLRALCGRSFLHFTVPNSAAQLQKSPYPFPPPRLTRYL